MGKRLDLTNQKIGEWTIIKEVEPILNNQGKPLRAWLCRCSCGTERILRQANLTEGRSTSCGCSRRKPKSEKRSNVIEPIEDHIGDKYGRLTIVGEGEERNQVKCICDCTPDKTIIKRWDNVFYGGTKSCGCLGRESKSSRHIENKYDFSNDGYVIGYDQRGNKFYVSFEDYDLIKQYTWNVNPQHGYVINAQNDIRMHRLIMDVENKNTEIDHLNHNRSDNRRENLRIVTRSENCFNMGLRKDNTSGYSGVRWFKRDQLWEARITVHGVKYYLGRYKNKTDAIAARKAAEEKYFGEYSYDNSQAYAQQYALPEQQITNLY